MTVSVSSLFGTQSNRIQEVLNKSIDFLLPTLDPFWRDNVVTSQGVGPVDDLGRDLKILKIYQNSMAGVFEPAGPRDDFVLYGDDLNQNLGAKVFTQGNGFGTSANTFPDPFQGPNARPYRLGIPMRAMMGNLLMTMGELSAEALPATIGEITAPKLRGWARKISHMLCNQWYLSQNNYYQITSIDTSTASVTTNGGATVLRFQPVNQAVDRLDVGHLVQIYDSTGTTLRSTTLGSGANNTTWMVTRKDGLENIVELVPLDGDTAFTIANVSNNDIVVFANSKGSATTPFSGSSRFTGIAGINSWLKWGDPSSSSDNALNCLLGDERDSSNAINVAVHSEFKSFNKDLAGQPLTEQLFRRIIRRFHAAKNQLGQEVDCFVASDGVWLAYEASKIGRERLDRTGRLSSINDQGSSNGKGMGGFEFTFDGKTYEGYTSTYVERGTVYGHKKGGGNWKRYVPPGPKGTRKLAQADSFAPFELVAGILTGTSSNHLPVYRIANNQNLLTEFMQMPGMLRMQLVPDQPAGIRLINCGEERIYSERTST